jgi:predicted LPLAT superfamily acyltransferase
MSNQTTRIGLTTHPTTRFSKVVNHLINFTTVTTIVIANTLPMPFLKLGILFEFSPHIVSMVHPPSFYIFQRHNSTYPTMNPAEAGEDLDVTRDVKQDALASQINDLVAHHGRFPEKV